MLDWFEGFKYLFKYLILIFEWKEKIKEGMTPKSESVLFGEHSFSNELYTHINTTHGENIHLVH